MDQLPVELLLEILKHLNIYDIVQFCAEIKNFKFLLREKCLTSSLNWSRNFEIQNMNLCKFIETKINPDNVTSLNINGIFWIPEKNLKRLLMKLPNLNELYAVDTKLIFCPTDTFYYKLKKLAIPADIFMDKELLVPNHYFNGLKYLQLILLPIVPTLTYALETRSIDFFDQFSGIEELWILEKFPMTLIYIVNHVLKLQVNKNLKSLKKIVLKSSRVYEELHELIQFMENDMGLTKTFYLKSLITGQQLILERLPPIEAKQKSIFEPEETEFEEAWFQIQRGQFLLCGPRDFRFLFIGRTVKQINFEELNFTACTHDNKNTCLNQERYNKAVFTILNSENCKYLKKLRIYSCLFQVQNLSHSQQDSTERVVFKKPRLGVKSICLNHPFQETAKNLSYLEELEIDYCSMSNNSKDAISSVLCGYNYIVEFKKLKRLKVKVPYLLLDGSFLTNVFKECQNLNFLDLSLGEYCPSLNVIMKNSLQFATNLKDLKLSCGNIDIEELLRNLSKLKLHRLVLQCNILYIIPENVFTTFLFFQPHLVLFLLVPKSVRQNITCKINSVLRKCTNSNPAKFFSCVDNIGEINWNKSGKTYKACSSAHLDFVYQRTRVAIIDFDLF